MGYRDEYLYDTEDEGMEDFTRTMLGGVDTCSECGENLEEDDSDEVFGLISSDGQLVCSDCAGF